MEMEGEERKRGKRVEKKDRKGKEKIKGRKKEPILFHQSPNQNLRFLIRIKLFHKIRKWSQSSPKWIRHLMNSLHLSKMAVNKPLGSPLLTGAPPYNHRSISVNLIFIVFNFILFQISESNESVHMPAVTVFTFNHLWMGFVIEMGKITV